MSAATVSAIIPVYRAAHTIGRALDSVLAQTRPPDEIVLVDDGSPDDLASALAPYGGRVKLLRKANGGAAAARNFGVDHSAGDLIAFLDADDYWEPRKLERQLDVLARRPEVGVVAGRFFTQDPGRERTVCLAGHPSLYGRVWTDPPGPTAFEIARRISTIAILFRRDVLGSRRFDEGLATAEDVDLWIRLVTAAPVYLDPEPLATAVREAGSLSRGDVARDSRNMLTVVRRHAGLLGRAATAAWETQVYREWAARELGDGDPAAALDPACRRLLRQPWSAQAWWIVFKSAAWAARRRGVSRSSPLRERSAGAATEHSCESQTRKGAASASRT